jgi:hypothetical protein|nr:MAG TPA: Helicase ATPase REPLICATION [Crassvirales sp.]
MSTTKRKSLTDKVLDLISTAQAVDDVQKNIIPLSFQRFKRSFPGIQRATYHLITAYSNGGKSQFTCAYFLFEPILKAFYSNGRIKVNVIAFPLEETQEDIMLRFISYLLYRNLKKVAPKSVLKGTHPEQKIDEETKKYMETRDFQSFLRYFESCMLFKSADTMEGIEYEIERYAEMHGTIEYEEKEEVDEVTGVITTTKVPESYKIADDNKYVIIWLDHISLLMPSKGESLKASMDRLSKYLKKKAANFYKFIPVVVQQQSGENETQEAVKAKRTRPTRSGLADTKYTYRDADVMMGIYSPAVHDIPQYAGYDIKKYRDNIRFLSIEKNRDGEVGSTIGLIFCGAMAYFKEAKKPEGEAGYVADDLKLIETFRK